MLQLINILVLYLMGSFMRQHLGAGGPEQIDVAQLKLDNEELHQQNEALKNENLELREKVWHFHHI